MHSGWRDCMCARHLTSKVKFDVVAGQLRPARMMFWRCRSFNLVNVLRGCCLPAWLKYQRSQCIHTVKV